MELEYGKIILSDDMESYCETIQGVKVYKIPQDRWYKIVQVLDSEKREYVFSILEVIELPEMSNLSEYYSNLEEAIQKVRVLNYQLRPTVKFIRKENV